MFKFFRSIRQNLLNENRTAKYIKYAVGEIVLVIVGILIALQINSWNQNRLLRIEEVEVVARMMEDIEADLVSRDQQIGRLERKEVSLFSVSKTFAEEIITDPKSFLSDILDSTDQGWVPATSNRPTFDDLIESGKLGIVESPDIRKQISRYYRRYETEIGGITRRQTPYPNMTRQFIPTDRNYFRGQLDPSLSDDDIAEIARVVLESPLKDYVTAELNYTRFFHKDSHNLKRNGEELLEVLKVYHAQIQE